VGVHPPSVWIGFSAVVALLLVLDLFVLNRRSHVLAPKEALTWSGILVALALLFGLFLISREGVRHGLEFYTGYLIELSLSVDNLFVFVLVFQYFAVPPKYQPRVLKWGILGAIVMRLVMIMLGAALLQRFEWIIYVFGGLLIVTGIRMARTQAEDTVDPARNIVARLARRFLPFTDHYDGQKFVTRLKSGAIRATPLLLVLLVIEWTDLVFAIDSIPAIFAVTRDPFLVYSSNIFAILGLRALFFVLASAMERFVYLKAVSAWVHVPILLSLAVIIGSLVTAIGLSLRKTTRPAGA
jgi:tellurite resistance protein TerC